MLLVHSFNYFIEHIFKWVIVFQACGDAKSKPGFLSDKSLESSIKYIVRRFPNIDTKGVSIVTHNCSRSYCSLGYVPFFVCLFFFVIKVNSFDSLFVESYYHIRPISKLIRLIYFRLDLQIFNVNWFVFSAPSNNSNKEWNYKVLVFVLLHVCGSIGF